MAAKPAVIKCFDLLKFLLPSYLDEHGLPEPSGDKTAEVELNCNFVDRFAELIEAEGVEVEINDTTNDIELSVLVCYAEVLEPNVIMAPLLERAKGFRLEQGGKEAGDLTKWVFVFDSVW